MVTRQNHDLKYFYFIFKSILLEFLMKLFEKNASIKNSVRGGFISKRLTLLVTTHDSEQNKRIKVRNTSGLTGSI
jgi:hypothetical protein